MLDDVAGLIRDCVLRAWVYRAVWDYGGMI